MRCQGKITTWKDDQGFGFITPNEGGDRVFVHVKAFSNKKRRPVGNEIVTYESVQDEKGRARAKHVAFLDDRRPIAWLHGRRSVLLSIAIIFLVFVTVFVFVGELPVTVLGLYLGASVVAFTAYAIDKEASRNGRWRTQESTLHMLGLLGGWPGALVAQTLLRHKSKKRSFQVIFWTTTTLNCAALVWLLTSQGQKALRFALGVIG